MSLDYRRLTVGPLQTNCYLLWDTATLKAAIIDPGGDREAIAAAVRELGLTVERILLTHGHADHAFFAGDLAREYGAKVCMHGADVVQLADGLGVRQMFYDLSDHVSFNPDELLEDGDSISLGESSIRVICTPGHSEGGLSFVCQPGVFCGDTVFAGSIGRTDFPGGDYETLMSSIRNKILTLDDSTVLFPGHGPQTTVGAERRSNPFLNQ